MQLTDEIKTMAKNLIASLDDFADLKVNHKINNSIALLIGELEDIANAPIVDEQKKFKENNQ